MARNWREIGADAIAQGRLDAAQADASRQAMHEAARARRLAETPKTQEDRLHGPSCP